MTTEREKLSPHFYRDEFQSNDGADYDTVDVELLKILEAVREHFNRPVVVLSGHRSPEWNKRVGGAVHSQHLKGRAADIAVSGISPIRVADYVMERFPEASIGRYATFTHIDTRTDGPAYWWSKPLVSLEDGEETSAYKGDGK